jgi:prepilin-type N-terminal cleavage/methylation domain-containing protein
MNRGFTLVEIVVSVAIFSLVMAGVFTLITNIFHYNNESQNKINNIWQAESLLRTMTKEFRMMVPSGNGSYPILAASTSSITFFANVNGDSSIEQVHYFFSTTTSSLYRGIVRPTGLPAVYNQATETKIVLASGIISSSTLPMFQYYGSSYEGVGSPLSFPVVISDIRLININLIIDSDLRQSPTEKIFSTSVSIRNLKSNQ